MTKSEQDRYDLAIAPKSAERTRKQARAIALLGIGMATFFPGYGQGLLLPQFAGFPILLSAAIWLYVIERDFHKARKVAIEEASDDRHKMGAWLV